MVEHAVHGTVAPGWERVRDAFAANFELHDEVGAAFAVYQHGELKADLWGGCADQANGVEWSNDTLQLVFSTTKGIAAICTGMLAQEGLLDFDATVASYWPEFGQNGKADFTVRQMMSHQCGLAAIDAQLSRTEVLSVTPVVKALEAQAPLWAFGDGHGYHALTYGWLVGELITRIDPAGRRINQFIQEEIAGPLDVDFWIGLPEAEEHRTAKLLDQPPPATQEEIEMMLAVLGPGTMGFRALTLDGAMVSDAGFAPVWNSRENHASEIPAANGITTARSLAAIYGATVAEVGGTRLLNPDTVADMTAEQVRGPDKTLVSDSRFGTGFMLTGEFTPLLNEGSFGHAGAGGSLGYADPETGIGYGYVMNQMGGHITGDPRTIGLNEAVRASL